MTYLVVESLIRSHLEALSSTQQGAIQRLRYESGPLVIIGMALTGFELSGVLLGSGAGGMILMLALLPAIPILTLGLWLDRNEPEPAWLLYRSFLWGACVATVVAGIGNTVVASVLGQTFALVGSAPVLEELMKGAALLWVMQRHPSHMDGRLDAVIYALFVGLGFAVVENVQYYGEALATQGVAGLTTTVILRGVFTPMLHPLFTLATAIGIVTGIRHGGASRMGLPFMGFAVAVCLHALWNSGIGMMLYPILGVPLFLVVAILAIQESRTEGARLTHVVRQGIAHGWFPADAEARLGLQSKVRLRDWMAAASDPTHPVHERWRDRRLVWLLASEEAAARLALTDPHLVATVPMVQSVAGDMLRRRFT